MIFNKIWIYKNETVQHIQFSGAVTSSCSTHTSLPAAAEAARGPVLDGGGQAVPVPDCGGPSPRTGSTGLSWPPGDSHLEARDHHIFKKKTSGKWLRLE